MKQSSIDWLVQQIEKSSKEGDIDFLLWNLKQNLLVKAKAMHKEEIENAYASGDDSDCLQEQEARMFAQVYYNETFNTKEK